jgi:putative addiction module CopG family antidote
MAISLSPETEKLLEERMDRGEFESADDMIRAALQALDEVDLPLDEETLDAIDRAEEEGERGEGYSLEEVKQYFRVKFSKKP